MAPRSPSATPAISSLSLRGSRWSGLTVTSSCAPEESDRFIHTLTRRCGACKELRRSPCWHDLRPGAPTTAVSARVLDFISSLGPWSGWSKPADPDVVPVIAHTCEPSRCHTGTTDQSRRTGPPSSLNDDRQCGRDPADATHALG